MANCPEEIIYVSNYKVSFISYMDLFAMKSRKPARGEIRNLESDLYDARMNLKNRLQFDDEKINSVQESALKEFLLNHEVNYVQKLRIILFFGMMKYTGNIENLQQILDL